MNRECDRVREALLDMVYADPSAAVGATGNAGSGKADSARTSATAAAGASMGDVARHLEECSECRNYAGALADIAVVLPAQRDGCVAEPGGGGSETPVGVGSASAGGAVAGISPCWARLSSTIERGVKLRIARERRAVGLFALTAAGILAAVWTPLLARSPQALLALQAVGFSGIALFYLPIHVLRARRGDDI
ncbi:MAG: hypothetical protein KA064_01945 [Firmicutes bacterium]|nr:hypothetical protein [Bacillota bacterium]